MSLFGSWMERGWLVNGWWKKRAGQYWCHNTFYDLLTIWSGWKQFICHRSSQCLTTRWCNYSLLQNHSELAQRSKNHFVTVRGLLASAFPWLQPLQLFPVGWVKLQVLRIKPVSIDDFKTAMEDINAILDKYICATAATIQKQFKGFSLADGGNFEHFLTSI